MASSQQRQRQRSAASAQQRQGSAPPLPPGGRDIPMGLRARLLEMAEVNESTARLALGSAELAKTKLVDAEAAVACAQRQVLDATCHCEVGVCEAAIAVRQASVMRQMVQEMVLQNSVEQIVVTEVEATRVTEASAWPIPVSESDAASVPPALGPEAEEGDAQSSASARMFRLLQFHAYLLAQEGNAESATSSSSMSHPAVSARTESSTQSAASAQGASAQSAASARPAASAEPAAPKRQKRNKTFY